MKDTLDAESKQALVQYRLERGVNSLEEAQYMAKGGYYNAAINRLYYACYYAVVALLLKNDIPAQTHHGVRSMLGLHFTSKGKLSMDSNRTFSTLFEKKHSSDYDDFVYCDQEMVDELYPKAEAFIDEVKELIESSHKTIKKIDKFL
ncbi:MAG: HEPN domain-containing protein [Bacteroidales bacterium]|nr:HEPN domain-containing protein [Bacteroidales bacterium]